MKKKSLWYRSRGLEKMEKRFGKQVIEKDIALKLKTEKTVRVLEIGFGEGKCLLELRAKFPNNNVELYGVNNKKTGNMYKQSDFLKNAKLFGMVIPNANLPKPYFFDAGEGLRFRSNFFDIIISQVAFHYIGNKAKVLEEVWRVLKVGGKAYLHIDSSYDTGSPDFLKLNEETPRFVIYRKEKIVKLSQYLRKFRKKGFKISGTIFNKKKDKHTLIMEKNKHTLLKLNLKYDGNSTLYLTKLKDSDKYKNDSSIWWGTRSIFKTK